MAIRIRIVGVDVEVLVGVVEFVGEDGAVRVNVGVGVSVAVDVGMSERLPMAEINQNMPSKINPTRTMPNKTGKVGRRHSASMSECVGGLPWAPSMLPPGPGENCF